MLVTTKSPQHNQSNRLKRGMVIELIGPAGAGKSTLYKALGELGPEFIQTPLPPVWNISYLMFFIKNIFSLVPTLFHLINKCNRQLTRQEVAWMAMLNGWPELLIQQTANCQDVIIIDQGPIFLIGTLYGFGPSGLQNFEEEIWWRKIFERWIGVVDIIVWLDSSDQELTLRIRKRDDSHEVKASSDQEIRDFLAMWRKVYIDVMKRFILKNPGLQLVKIDSGQLSVEEIVRKVMDEIERRNGTDSKAFSL